MRLLWSCMTLFHLQSTAIFDCSVFFHAGVYLCKNLRASQLWKQPQPWMKNTSFIFAYTFLNHAFSHIQLHTCNKILFFVQVHWPAADISHPSAASIQLQHTGRNEVCLQMQNAAILALPRVKVSVQHKKLLYITLTHNTLCSSQRGEWVNESEEETTAKLMKKSWLPAFWKKIKNTQEVKKNTF